jgi:hypothetical protein
VHVTAYLLAGRFAAVPASSAPAGQPLRDVPVSPPGPSAHRVGDDDDKGHQARMLPGTLDVCGR